MQAMPPVTAWVCRSALFAGDGTPGSGVSASGSLARRPRWCGTRGRIRPEDLPITSRMLRVDLDGSRRIEPAHVGCVVGPDGSRRIQKDRLDDHMDDQGASDTESDAKASTVVALFIRRSLGDPVPVRRP